MTGQFLHFVVFCTLLLVTGCSKQPQSKTKRYLTKAEYFHDKTQSKYQEEIELAQTNQKDDLINCSASKNEAVRWYTSLFGNPELSRNTPLHKAHRRITRDLRKLNGQIRKLRKLVAPHAVTLTYKLEDLKADLITIKKIIRRHPEFRQENKFSSSYIAMNNLNNSVSSLRSDLAEQNRHEEEPPE